MNAPQDSERDYGQSRAERLNEEGVLIESDMPPPEYTQTRGERDADLSKTGRLYAAVVTAHFPDAASADRAIEGLSRLNLTGTGIQRFEKEAPEAEGDVNDPGLEPGEVAVIAHLADESQGPEGVRICEEAGAKHAKFFPAQRMGEVVPHDNG